jgi:hypothetical protein
MELIDLKEKRAEKRGKEIKRVIASLPGVEHGGPVVKSRRDVEIVLQRLREGEHALNEKLSSIFYDVCEAQSEHAWAQDLCVRHKIGEELIAAINKELRGSCEPRLDRQKIAAAGREEGIFRDIFDAALGGKPWAIELLWRNDFGREHALSLIEMDGLEPVRFEDYEIIDAD